jgi:hypothetical protein
MAPGAVFTRTIPGALHYTGRVADFFRQIVGKFFRQRAEHFPSIKRVRTLIYNGSSICVLPGHAGKVSVGDFACVQKEIASLK